MRKILAACGLPAIPDLLKGQRQSGKRLAGPAARNREWRRVRQQAHVLPGCTRAIFPHDLAVFEVRDTCPVRGMNAFAKVSLRGRRSRRGEPFLPRSDEID